jgi:hypothetical protein
MSLPPPLPLNTSRALSCVVIAVIFPVLATLCVVGRFISRRIQRGGYGADDWIILLALLAVYGQMTIIIMSTVYGGVGFHIKDLSKENLVMFYKVSKRTKAKLSRYMSIYALLHSSLQPFSLRLARHWG